MDINDYRSFVIVCWVNMYNKDNINGVLFVNVLGGIYMYQVLKQKVYYYLWECGL